MNDSTAVTVTGKTAWSYDSSTGTMNCGKNDKTENQRKHSFFQYTKQKKNKEIRHNTNRKQAL